jgi:hypothetical protein
MESGHRRRAGWTPQKWTKQCWSQTLAITQNTQFGQALTAWPLIASTVQAALRAHWLRDHVADCDRRGVASELAADRSLRGPGIRA